MFHHQGQLGYAVGYSGAQVEANARVLADAAGCSHDSSYVAIIIAVVPLWAILTTLIVIALLMFHKHIQAGDQSQISEQLTLVDYTLLIYLFCSFTFFAATHENLPDVAKAPVSVLPNNPKPPLGIVYKDRPPSQAATKGLLVGCICFSITFALGLILRYLFRQNYALKGNATPWAYVYHSMSAAIVLVATGLWVYTTLMAYRDLCSNSYRSWLLTLSVAMVEALFFGLMASLVAWTVATCWPIYHEQIILPDDVIGYQPGPSGSRDARGSRRSTSRSNQQQSPTNMNDPSPSALMMPAGGGSTHSGGMQQPWHTPTGPMPMMQQGGTGGAYGPPYMMMGQQQNYPSPKPAAPYPYTAAQPYQPYDAAGHQYHQQQPVPPLYGPPQLPPTPPQTSPALAGVLTPTNPAPTPPPKLQLPTLHHMTPNKDTYQQQTTIGSGKTSKKVGSSESTGSTYYQQLMKKKGGVKSISQYGELLKQKKNKK